jgi:hypothetical protein
VLGCQTGAEGDQNDAADSVDGAADATATQEVTNAIDDWGVGAEPEEGHRAEDEAETEEREERAVASEVRQEADKKTIIFGFGRLLIKPWPKGPKSSE